MENFFGTVIATRISGTKKRDRFLYLSWGRTLTEHICMGVFVFDKNLILKSFALWLRAIYLQ
tara:strand:+ start:425 stop:610 length:186 start_codon:yes stop_codon:yes gene_type:complete